MKNQTNHLLIFFILMGISLSSWGQTQKKRGPKEKVVIKYKKYESFDLGDLEIEGKLLVPGDLSIKEYQRKKFKRKLFERRNFDPEMRRDIKNLN